MATLKTATNEELALAHYQITRNIWSLECIESVEAEVRDFGGAQGEFYWQVIIWDDGPSEGHIMRGGPAKSLDDGIKSIRECLEENGKLPKGNEHYE